MKTNLDLAVLIRCLEVMADENSWEESVLTNGRWLIDATEAPPWEVAKEALAHVNAIELSISNAIDPTEAFRRNKSNE